MVSSGTLLRIAVFAALASMLLALVPTTDEVLLPDSNEPMETGARSGPDLIVDYLSASWTSADAGDSKSISTRIKNDGDSSSGSFRWGLYLSTDTTITTSDLQLDYWTQSSISAGSTRSSTKTVTIPSSITGGYYYVGMIVDINSQVSESDENNNDDYDSGRVHVYELADLVPRTTSSSCSTPATGTIGDYLDSSISIQYENDVSSSHGQSTGTFYWAMYLSTDSTITTSDTQVGSDQYSSSLSSGSYRTDSLSSSNRIPSNMNAGTYYWGYILDVDSDVDEASESNNVRTCNQITLQEDLPDLEATSVSTSSSSATMGDTITVQYRIDNIGTDYSGSFYWKLYLSTDSTITTSDTLVDEFSESTISGGSYRSSYEYNVPIPTGMSPGYHYLGMIVDNRNGVNELDETNNVVSSSSRIDIEEAADLVPDSPSGPNSAQAGQQVSISWRIDNTGDDASGWFYWEMYISTDSTITTSDTKLGSTQQANSISGGSYRSGTYSTTLPSNLGQGTYYFGIIADSSSRVNEGDETNNIEVGNSIYITVPDYDLEATSISVDSGYRQVCEGADIYISLTVTNLGSDNAGSHYYEALVSTGNSVSAIYTGTSLGYASGTPNVPSYTHTSMLATLPTSITPGTYYVGLYADYGDYISETDENNNIVASSSAQLTVLDCGPDLEPTSVSGPTSGVRGGTAQVSVQIANVGMEDVTNVDYSIYLSSDSSISGGGNDVLIGSDVANSIAQSGSWSGNINLGIPSNLGDGCWYWGIIVDPNDSISEMDETNNAMPSSGQFCVEQADIVIDSISASENAVSGQTTTVYMNISNAGGSDAASFNVQLVLSLDAQAGTDDTQVDTFRVNPLASGSTVQVAREVTIPGQHIGQFHWVVIVDTASEIAEDDENNNVAASIGFEISAPAKDLLASWVESPLSAEPGQTVTIEWGAENLGQESLGFDVEIWLSDDRSLGSGDIRLSQSRVPSLLSGSTLADSQVVNLVGDVEGVWWVVLVIDASEEHYEDDESNNIRISNATLTIDSNSPPPAGETLPGCDNPQTDGDFSSDAASTRSSAHHLGANPNLTLDGCLMGLDEVDWYAIVIDSGNQTSIALSAEGAILEVAVLNGSASLGQGAVDDDIRWVTISALNDDSEGMALLYHIRVTWDPSNPGGPYQLRLVTANASTETDLVPPPAPEIIAQDEWTHADEIVIQWPPVIDDLSGVSHYEVRWAGGLWAPIDGNESLVNLSMLMDGRHSFEVRAIDAAGNIGPADATWIRVDRQAPIISLEQIEANRSPVSKLVVELNIDDGDGSGPSIIQWSADNSTWNDFPADGLILWDDWNNTNLFVQVTDGAGLITLSELAIEIPPEDITPIDNSDNQEESTTESNGGVNSMLAIIVVLAIIVLSVFTVILAIKLKARQELESELEEDEGEDVTHSPVDGGDESETNHVPDHTHLIGGGVYDQSTGHTAYIDPDGRWWWQQEDGSFYHDPALNASDATQDDLP
ncbi:MAG: CARDB domain-containing protein [Candidatus Thermoplasmatota archaeon]|nr:CARDB domain-containing protein [Candidatus Thermoplasmatota archaeon]